MTCEFFLTQMYAQRPGSDTPLPQEFADHLRTCASCSREFARMVEQDASIRQTMHSVSVPSTLEASILAGLALERTSSAVPTNSRTRGWRRWLWVPAAVAALVMVSVFAYARWQSQSALQQVAGMLHVAPTLSMEGEDREQILRWSEQVEPGASSLPSRLDRVQFLGAAAVQVNHHSAVLLRMKHEPRASLLVLDHPLLGTDHIKSRSAGDGSLAYWSEQKKSYVLLFQGNQAELQSYMQRMGITA